MCPADASEQPTQVSAGERPVPEEKVAPAPGIGTELRARFRYRLIKRLGRGSFGSVFFARCLDADARRDDSPPQKVAVKILGSTKGAAVDLLRRELAAMIALEDDRIPRVYDWRLDGDHAFVVMQYYAEGSLREALAAQEPVPEERIWRLLADVLAALDVAHRHSVLHLDVKPANVLIDGDGFVLTDFGVSQASRVSRGLMPMSVGTRGYQAPEQRNERFDQYDLRTDLWGVGATAWAVATGINLAERDELVREGDGAIYGLPPLSERRIYCSPELEEVVMSLLHLDPARRPGSVAEVLARVDAVRAGRGLGGGAFGASRHVAVDEAEAEAVIETLVDPLLISICRQRAFRSYFAKFEDGEMLCSEGEVSACAFLLLRGTVVVTRDDDEIARVSREGHFLGEVATLTGLPRTASMRASGTVWAVALNAADLERFITANPAMGLRVVRALAQRLAKLNKSDGR
jgi:hypothetical protein